MLEITQNILKDRYGIQDYLLDMASQVEDELQEAFKKIKLIREYNTAKVLGAFQELRLSDHHFAGSTGYGYGDSGRDTLEDAYAMVFGGEAALVRAQIASGTHAISSCLFANMNYGDELISISGTPYDTLRKVIGIQGNEPGNLISRGCTYKEVPLDPNGDVDFEAIERYVTSNTKMVMLQRSRGYSLRPAITIEKIARAVDIVKKINPGIIFFVDNCYGEFVEELEPPQVGVDLMAGSLIKNPGGSLAPAGGYIVGKKEYVDMTASYLIAPGIGSAVGATLGINRLLFQGLYLSPLIVGEALQGAAFIGSIMAKLGYTVSPKQDDKRTDIIQAVNLGDRDKLIAFCQTIQSMAPVDAFVVPYPAPMPGYSDEVIMAGGTFIQGSSIELSADAPIREPYTVFIQGGTSFEQVKFTILKAIQIIQGNGR